MGHRNIMCNSDMIEIGMDNQQGQGGFIYHGPPLRIPSQAVPTNFHPPNVRTMMSSSGQYLPERPDGAFFYGTMQYNGVHHHHSFYPPFVPGSTAGVLREDHLPSSNGYVGSSAADEFGRGNYYFAKSKVPESVQPTYHHFNAPVAPPMPSVSEAVSFPVGSSQFGGPVMMHDRNHLSRSNFPAGQQHFQPPGIWLEPPVATDNGALVWSQSPAMPFVHAPIEPANVGVPRHHEIIRSSQTARQVSTANQRHQSQTTINPNHNNASLPVLRPPREASSLHNRSSSSSNRTNRSLPHQRHAGAVPPTSFRIYHPHSSRNIINNNNNSNLHNHHHHHHHQHLAQLRYIQADEVAILEIPDYYEIGEYNSDHHSDLRLDIEDMSYEELLALGERIGSVNTGLSEATVKGRLKTVPYLSPEIDLTLEQEKEEEETESSDKDPHCCIICQDNYKNSEKIGVLDCGHDYHAECLTKWLVIKNVCPVCKCEALSTKKER